MEYFLLSKENAFGSILSVWQFEFQQAPKWVVSIHRRHIVLIVLK